MAIPATEIDLIRAAQGGDDAALGRLLMLHQPRLNYHLTSRLPISASGVGSFRTVWQAHDLTLHSLLGDALRRQEKFAEAETHLIAAFENLVADPTLPSDERRQREFARQRIVALYKDWKRPADAERWNTIPPEDRPMKDLPDLLVGAGKSAAGGRTASSLLEQVRAADAGAWFRLSRLYGPLVHYWARRNGLGVHDAADVVQEVFEVVHRRIHEFRRDRVGDSFRKWLKAIANNKIREHWRRTGHQANAEGGSTAQLQMNQLADPSRSSEAVDGDEGEFSGDGAEIGWLHRRAMDLIQDEFATTTWRAFYGVIAEGRNAADVAADLGVSRNAVYIAKSRVLSRLRIEFADLLTENHEPTEDSH